MCQSTEAACCSAMVASCSSIYGTEAVLVLGYENIVGCIRYQQMAISLFLSSHKTFSVSCFSQKVKTNHVLQVTWVCFDQTWLSFPVLLSHPYIISVPKDLDMASAPTKHRLSGDSADSHLARPWSRVGSLRICPVSLRLFPFLFQFGEKTLLTLFIPSVSCIVCMSCAESENNNI